MSNDERESNNMDPLVPGGDTTVVGVVATAVAGVVVATLRIVSGRKQADAKAAVTVLSTWQTTVGELRRDIEALRIDVREAQADADTERLLRIERDQTISKLKIHCANEIAQMKAELDRVTAELNILLKRGIVVPKKGEERIVRKAPTPTRRSR